MPGAQCPYCSACLPFPPICPHLPPHAQVLHRSELGISRFFSFPELPEAVYMVKTKFKSKHHQVSPTAPGCLMPSLGPSAASFMSYVPMSFMSFMPDVPMSFMYFILRSLQGLHPTLTLTRQLLYVLSPLQQLNSCSTCCPPSSGTHPFYHLGGSASLTLSLLLSPPSPADLVASFWSINCNFVTLANRHRVRSPDRTC